MNLLIRFFGTILLIFIGFSGFLLLIFYIINKLHKNSTKSKSELSQTKNKLILSSNSPYFSATMDCDFDLEYLNTTLDDGKTVLEHMEKKYTKQKYLSSKQSKKDFPKTVNEQYSYIINRMDIRSEKFNNIIYEEELLLKTFLEKVSKVRKNYSINLIRFGNGMIRIEYNGCQIGQFNFRNKEFYLQALQGEKHIREFENIKFNECLEKIDIWVRYCKYQLKETRF